ncbi:MAG: ABC transporter permease, partial [Dehalococcoidia bacterium]
ILLGTRGIVNETLGRLGIAPIVFLYDEKGIDIGLVQVQLPLMILSIAAAVQRIDFTLVRAARSLGASRWIAFWKVVIPLSLPGIRTGCLLVFSLAMSAYATPALIGGPTIKVMSYLIYEQGLSLLNWPFAATISIVLLASTAGVLGFVSAFGQIREWSRATSNRLYARTTRAQL